MKPFFKKKKKCNQLKEQFHSDYFSRIDPGSLSTDLRLTPRGMSYQGLKPLTLKTSHRGEGRAGGVECQQK